MMARKKWFILLTTLIVVIGVIYLAFPLIVNHIGRGELLAIAQEKNYCTTQSCDEGIQVASEILQKKSGLSAESVPWCLATNRLYFTEFTIGNALKNKFANWMYHRCERDDFTLDDVNMSIGEPHSE